MKHYLKYVKKLKDKLQRVKDHGPIECEDCFDAIADGYTSCGDCGME